MARPGPKPKTLDVNQFAAAILEAVTGEPVGPQKEEGPAKDPAAVALGSKGGLKGGPARAKKLGKTCPQASATSMVGSCADVCTSTGTKAGFTVQLRSRSRHSISRCQ